MPRLVVCVRHRFVFKQFATRFGFFCISSQYIKLFHAASIPWNYLMALTEGDKESKVITKKTVLIIEIKTRLFLE